jgi:hypothetical protein
MQNKFMFVTEGIHYWMGGLLNNEYDVSLKRHRLTREQQSFRSIRDRIHELALLKSGMK